MLRFYATIPLLAGILFGCMTDTTESPKNEVKDGRFRAIPNYLGRYEVVSVNGVPAAENTTYTFSGGHLVAEVIHSPGDTSLVAYTMISTHDSLIIKRVKHDPRSRHGAHYLPREKSSLAVSGATLTLTSGSHVIVLTKQTGLPKSAGPVTDGAWILQPWIITSITHNDDNSYWNDFNWPGKIIVPGIGFPYMTSALSTAISYGISAYTLGWVPIPSFLINQGFELLGVSDVINGAPVEHYFDFDPPTIVWPYIGFSSTHMKSETLNFEWSNTDHFYGMAAVHDYQNGYLLLNRTDFSNNNAVTEVLVFIWKNETGEMLNMMFLTSEGEPFNNLTLHATLAPGYSPIPTPPPLHPPAP
jgi:hypothetical protein